MSTARRPSAPTPSGTHPDLTPVSQLTPDETRTVNDADTAFRHVDYDRHPLRVHGLDRYVDGPISSERFHIG